MRCMAALAIACIAAMAQGLRGIDDVEAVVNELVVS